MLINRKRLSQWQKRLKLFSSGQPGNAYPLYILGTQRSGTNMMVDVFDKSPDTECYFESDNVAYDNYVLRDATTIDRLVQRSRARVVVFKALCEVQNAKRLLNSHEGARGIWPYRDYNDVVNSALRNFKEHRQYLYYMLYDKDVAKWRAENVSAEDMELVRRFYESDVSEESARALIWYIRNALYFQQELEISSKVRLAKYEQLVADPQLHFPELFDFAGITRHPRSYNFVQRTSIAKNPSPVLDSEIRELCDEMMWRLDQKIAQETDTKTHRKGPSALNS